MRRTKGGANDSENLLVWSDLKSFDNGWIWMREDPDGPEQHRARSEFIRGLIQCNFSEYSASSRFDGSVPRTIVQYWHNLRDLPGDIEECIASWSRWEKSGFTHRLFDEATARAYIRSTLGTRHERAFEQCYHPAMQADYFRLCYLLVEGGFYVDADDVCISADIEWLFGDGRLKLQPLCYDLATEAMVKPSRFLTAAAYDPGWIFYFNNNPLIATAHHSIIQRALDRATRLLEIAGTGELPEIQSTTGPGNLSKAVFEEGMASDDLEADLIVLRHWESLAVSKWPSSHREDARNWRLSNQKKFDRG